ncbi:MAG: transglycosylase SLT domain-containing protein [Patescibacteria group bacterium]
MSIFNTRKNNQKGFIVILIPIAVALILFTMAIVFLGAAANLAQKSCGIVKLINVVTLGTVGTVSEFSTLCDRLGTLSEGEGQVSCTGTGEVYAKYMPDIKAAVEEFPSVNEAQLIALIEHESANWKEDAISSSGAIGLGQFVFKTANADNNVKDIFGKVYKVEAVDNLNITEVEKEAFRVKHGPSSSEPDGRFDAKKSILAAAAYLNYQLGRDGFDGSFKKAYIDGYHGHGGKNEQKQLKEAQEGWARIKAKYDALMSGEGSCERVANTEPFSGSYLKPSGQRIHYTTSQLPTYNNKKLELYFDTTFGDALTAAFAEINATDGLSITVFSGTDLGGHTEGSRHYSGLAADIAGFPGCSSPRIYYSGGCNDRIEEIMAKHGLINLCHAAFARYPNGDCNHFQLADPTSVKTWVKYNPNGVWANFTPNSSQKIYIKTRTVDGKSKKFTYTISSLDSKKYNIVAVPSNMVSSKKEVDKLYINSNFLAKLKSAWDDPECKGCFVIRAAFRTKNDQGDAWNLSGCPAIPKLSKEEEDDYSKRTMTCDLGRTAVPGYSIHELGEAVDIDGAKGKRCDSHNCDKVVAETLKKHGVYIFKACDPVLQSKQNGLYVNDDSGSDCWHFSTNGF